MNEVVAAIVAVGYEQAGCNTEGLVDMDDALRIWIERDGAWSWDWIDELDAVWSTEFPEGRAQ